MTDAKNRRSKQWREANTEWISAYNNAYKAEHREQIAAYGRVYREANRESQRAYRLSRRAERHAYYIANRDKQLAQMKALRVANPEKARADNRAKYLRNPEQWSHATNLRRARKRGNGGTHTLAEWQEKLTLFAGCCIYCGRDDRPLTRDHKVPLTRGGTDDIANLVPACRSCNSKKRTLTAQEFLALRAS